LTAADADRLRVSLQPATPWSLRLIAALGLPAFLGGAALGLALFALFLLFTALFGEAAGRLAGVGFEWGWLAELIQDLFVGFGVAVVAASVDGTRREIEALRPHLAPSLRDAEDLPREVLRYPRWLLAASGAVGVLSAVATVLSPGLWADGRMPGWTHASVIWLFARNALVWWIVLRGLALELVLAFRFSQLAEQIESVELLDRAAFAPFSRRALRSVLLWMLLAAWVSLTYVGPGWAVGELLTLGLVTLAGFAFAAFLLPLLGPHRRLRKAKARELARVGGAVAALRERAIAADPREVAGGRLADLLAYEARVAGASTWPLESSTVARFGVYLALGLGSWVGAGLVQHALERLIP
jgi:hypothetical protein